MSLMVMPHSIFLHVPRTGGTWVNRVAEEHVHGAYTLEDTGHTSFPKAHQFNTGNKRTFMLFVRHPLAWYKSYYRRRRKLGWTPCPEDETWKSDTFDGYVNNVIDGKGQRAYVSRMYRRFVDDYEDMGAGELLVGRYETLVNDFIGFLDLVGEKYSREGISNFGRRGVTTEEKLMYTDAQIAQLMEIEKEALDKYEYVGYTQ